MAAKPRKRRSKARTAQPRIPGTRRRPMGTAAEPALETAIRREMDRYDVSRSFVLAECAAYALGVTLAHHYKPQPRVLRVLQGGKRKAG